MGFLASLYLAGIAAVGFPIVFHMIRRTPRGRIPFSTLMFLEASPPRVTNRSRIEHWFLLLLRALAVTLLALAFSRPFLRESEDLTLEEAGRRVAILIDTSASMRREDLGEQAIQAANVVLDDLAENDALAVFAFDRELRPLLSFAEWADTERLAAIALVKQRIADLKPGFAGTDLGRVLPEAVTATLDRSNGQSKPARTELIVISDLQRGSRCDALQVFGWPDSVRVSVKPVKARGVSNAGIQIVGTSASEDGLRVRVDNADDSSVERFGVLVERQSAESGVAEAGHETDNSGTDRDARSDADRTASSDPDRSSSSDTNRAASSGTDREASSDTEPAAGSTVAKIDDVFVPPNQNRVVKIAELPDDASRFRILLSGDEAGFDNAAWFVRPEPARVRVEYFGDGDSSNPQELRYYVERALLPTDQRIVDFVAGSDTDFASINDGTLTVVAQLLDKSQSELLQERAAAGRPVFVVGTSLDVCRQAFELAGLPAPEVTEASVESYAMLSDVDTSHVLFAPFHEAKLADFTKLPIWRHRAIEETSLKSVAAGQSKTLARFDGGGPAVVELAAGRGSVTLFLFGWHSPDSRLVLWSKFVPLLNAIVDRVASSSFEPVRLVVGDRVSLPQLIGDAVEEVRITEPPPSGTQATASGAAELTLQKPGIYEIAWQSDAGPRSTLLAVNLDPSESHTAPLGLAELRALGVPLSDAADELLTPDEKRQLQASELESRQRFWKWVILAGLLLLLLETWIAGRLSRGAEAIELRTVPAAGTKPPN